MKTLLALTIAAFAATSGVAFAGFAPIKGSAGYTPNSTQNSGFSPASVGQATWNQFGNVRELSVLKADGTYKILSRFEIDSDK